MLHIGWAFVSSYLYFRQNKTCAKLFSNTSAIESASQPTKCCGKNWEYIATLAPHGWDVINLFHQIIDYMIVNWYKWKQSNLYCLTSLNHEHINSICRKTENSAQNWDKHINLWRLLHTGWACTGNIFSFTFCNKP